MFDFDEIPTIQESINKRPKKNQHAEIRKSIKGIDKSYSRVRRDICHITKS